ncbi:MAG: hypothetical protein HZB16_13900 [Armatimonadetes bacterium]|nr:hypothetical protein [Armatimonadota bacterium]
MVRATARGGMMRHGRALVKVVMVMALASGAASGQLVLRADQLLPPLRALHGINKGPLAPGGLVEVTAAQTALHPPLTRLHDCHWPVPDVVDIHAVFPNPQADPSRPESYDFRQTDAYIAAVRATGAKVLYRLGESIEHTPVKRFAHPPADTERWVQVALGIIRHYNEGWANGHQWGIRYWEIWNEPENRPSCWSGTDDDYYRLYAAASRAIRAHDARLLVGGPSVGASGWFRDGRFEPTEFVATFLRRARDGNWPLDFFSWHCYTNDPTELVARSTAVRQLLDQSGHARSESHLNEWNYLPDADWHGGSREATPAERERYYQRMSGDEAATFVATALLELQAAPLTAANLFHGEVGPFGLFTEQGSTRPIYDAVLAFARLLDGPTRLAVDGAVPGKLAAVATLAGDRRSVTLLVTNYADAREDLTLTVGGLPWTGATSYEVRRVGTGQRLSDEPTQGRLEAGALGLGLRLPRPSLALVVLRAE